MRLALVLLAALTAPEMRLITNDDYHFQSVLRHETGGAAVMVTVDPAGRTLACETLQGFGVQRVADAVCDLLLHRRFEPAHLADGTRAYARMRLLFRFELPRIGRTKIPVVEMAPELALHDRQLPEAEDGKSVTVALAVDQHGAVTDCAGSKRSASLAARACAQAAMLPISPLTLPDGRVVPHITTRQVVLIRG